MDGLLLYFCAPYVFLLQQTLYVNGPLLSCAIMLEMLDVLMQSDRPFRHNLIFLFNGAEENLLPVSVENLVINCTSLKMVTSTLQLRLLQVPSSVRIRLFLVTFSILHHIWGYSYFIHSVLLHMFGCTRCKKGKAEILVLAVKSTDSTH